MGHSKGDDRREPCTIPDVEPVVRYRGPGHLRALVAPDSNPRCALYADAVPPSRRGLAVVLGLAPLGTVAGHVAGYAVAGEHAAFDGSHAHLRPTTWLTVVAACAALAWVATGRAGAGARPRLGRLAAAQIAAFVAVEAVEHLVAGGGVDALLHEPAVRWGLAAQVAVAAGLVVVTALARVSGVLVRTALSNRRRAVAATGSRWPATAISAVPHRPCSSASERGPPTVLVPA